MKKFIIQTILLLIVIGIAIISFNPKGAIPNLPFLPQKTVTKEITINDTKLKVEMADSQEKRSRGLAGRPSLATEEGMLFVFPKADKYPFWMKGLNFPLDFIWISGDQIVDLLENVPQPVAGSKDADLPIYSPQQEVDKVLEVSSGTIQRLNIKVGDMVKIL